MSPPRLQRCVSSLSHLKKGQRSDIFTLGREFDSQRDMEDAFLRKYYLLGKTSVMRRAIHEFSQRLGEVFYEA